jgi:hypothetical protein
MNKTKTIILSNLGFFTEGQCKRIKEKLQGKTYMDFDITWSNEAGNCTLIVRTEYDGTFEEIKSMFFNLVLSSL